MDHFLQILALPLIGVVLMISIRGKNPWHAILAFSGMIADILLMALAFVLGYVLFMSSIYFLAKWMLPKIEDEDHVVIPGNSSRHIRHTVRNGRYVFR